MSNTLISRFIFLNIILVLNTGCIKNEILSKNKFRHISGSEFSYRGAVEKSIDLKFSIEKNDVSKITAHIRLPDNYTDAVKYKWMLGAGVTISSGDIEKTIQPVEKNKSFDLQISVRGFNIMPVKHIRFEIIGKNPNHRIFADGIVSSDQENSFEATVKDVEQYKKENPSEK